MSNNKKLIELIEYAREYSKKCNIDIKIEQTEEGKGGLYYIDGNGEEVVLNKDNLLEKLGIIETESGFELL